MIIQFPTIYSQLKMHSLKKQGNPLCSQTRKRLVYAFEKFRDKRI